MDKCCCPNLVPQNPLVTIAAYGIEDGLLRWSHHGGGGPDLTVGAGPAYPGGEYVWTVDTNPLRRIDANGAVEQMGSGPLLDGTEDNWKVTAFGGWVGSEYHVILLGSPARLAIFDGETNPSFSNVGFNIDTNDSLPQRMQFGPDSVYLSHGTDLFRVADSATMSLAITDGTWKGFHVASGGALAIGVDGAFFPSVTGIYAADWGQASTGWTKTGILSGSAFCYRTASGTILAWTGSSSLRGQDAPYTGSVLTATVPFGGITRVLLTSSEELLVIGDGKLALYDAGLSLLWSRDLGHAFLYVAEADGDFILFASTTSPRRLLRISSDDGSTVWDVKFPAGSNGPPFLNLSANSNLHTVRNGVSVSATGQVVFSGDVRPLISVATVPA